MAQMKAEGFSILATRGLGFRVRKVRGSGLRGSTLGTRFVLQAVGSEDNLPQVVQFLAMIDMLTSIPPSLEMASAFRLEGLFRDDRNKALHRDCFLLKWIISNP